MAFTPTAQAKAVGSDAWFDNVVQVDDPGTLPPDVLRVKHSSFDANAAVASLVSAAALDQAVQGERIVVEPLAPSIQVAAMDDRVINISVDEVSVTQPFDGVPGVPGVQVLGSTVLEDGATTTATFVFVAEDDGSYALAGSLNEPINPNVTFQQVFESTYALSELAPAQIEGEGTDDVDILDEDGAALDDPAVDDGMDEELTIGGNYVIDVIAAYGNNTGVARATSRAEIAAWMEQTNQALKNSRVNVRVNLLESMYVNYNQSPQGLLKDMENMRDRVGDLRRLSQRRDALGADLTALIVPNLIGNACGRGALPLPKGLGSDGFSVSVRGAGCPSIYTFAHELGHNLGAHHNPEDAGGILNRPYAFSHGNTVPGVSRTVMGYSRLCGYDANCPVQLQFSSPAVRFLNAPWLASGDAVKRDNARSVRLLAPYTSEYRGRGLAPDVPRSHKFYTQIKWMLENRIASGYADGTFRPEQAVSRSAMAAFLYRFAGRPSFTPPKTSPFTDVPKTQQFYKEITWLRSTGITTGIAGGRFNPKGEVTREAMAAFLYRLNGKPAFTPPTTSPFTDVSKNQKFYREITWLRSTGIAKGRADGSYGPKGSTTRAAMSAFLYRYNAKFGR